MIAIDQKFEGIRIQLDGGTFIRCEFINCTLVFSGSFNLMMDRPTITNCQWVFEGAAQNTLRFLAMLYGAGGGELVEATFNNIRGKPGNDGLKLN